ETATRVAWPPLQYGIRSSMGEWGRASSQPLIRRIFLAVAALSHAGRHGPVPLSVAQPSLGGAILRHMKVEEIAEAVAKLPPDQLGRFRRWFTAFEAGRINHAEELDPAATKLGPLAAPPVSQLKNPPNDP